MPTIFLSLRGEDSSRALESFRRALGEDAQSLVVVPTNDESGYHGSADVGDVAVAREAFALARKPFPTLRAYLGAGGRDELPPRPVGEGHGRRAGERSPDGRAERQGRTGEGRGRGQEANGPDGRAGSRAQERPREKAPTPEGESREPRRATSRGRHRGGRRPQGSEPREGRSENG